MKPDLDYYDLSPEISEEIAVWPGDQAYRRSPSVSFETGGNLLLSSIQTTVHLGSHVDSPNHYHRQGQGMAERDLHLYLGPCQTITVNLPRSQRIHPNDLPKIPITTPRVLFRTDSYPNPNRWNEDFNSLSPELIEFLAAQKVVLVGIDTPSIDLADDRHLITHQAVFQHDMAVLEGICLKKVPDGVYTLIALPLRLQGADASPVRAILLRNKSFL